MMSTRKFGILTFNFALLELKKHTHSGAGLSPFPRFFSSGEPCLRSIRLQLVALGVVRLTQRNISPGFMAAKQWATAAAELFADCGTDQMVNHAQALTVSFHFFFVCYNSQFLSSSLPSPREWPSLRLLYADTMIILSGEWFELRPQYRSLEKQSCRVA